MRPRPMAAHAMRQGLHAASEVPIATTYQEAIDLVQVAEETQRHCIMLENCCYNGEELWIMQMIKEGVFGTLTHAECAYLHDLRAELQAGACADGADVWRCGATRSSSLTTSACSWWSRARACRP